MLSATGIITKRARLRPAQTQLVNIALSLCLVVALTAAIGFVSQFIDLRRVSILYLIPVLITAMRWGIIPAIICAVAGVAASAFFFYAPIYDFRVSNPEQVIDLILFIIVAVVTGKLAADVRDAQMRAEAEALREAFIGSVSHELRTPLSSIVGSASILAQAPDIAKNPHLFALTGVVREEAERLNEDIQNLLDATRISSAGLRPRPGWVDPADIVNAAVERKRRLLATHETKVTVADDLPLVHVDPALIEKALGQFIENAVKYSPPGSLIEITAAQKEDMLEIAVRDHGVGLSPGEDLKIWDRFYRSPHVRDRVAGSGLGLWIARALVAACGGRTDAVSAGVGYGSIFSLLIPAQHPDLEVLDD